MCMCMCMCIYIYIYIYVSSRQAPFAQMSGRPPPPPSGLLVAKPPESKFRPVSVLRLWISEGLTQAES